VSLEQSDIDALGEIVFGAGMDLPFAEEMNLGECAAVGLLRDLRKPFVRIIVGKSFLNPVNGELKLNVLCAGFGGGKLDDFGKRFERLAQVDESL